MGLPLDADVSNADPAVVKAGEKLLADAVEGGARHRRHQARRHPLFRAYQIFATMPTDSGRKNSIAAIARTADIAKTAGVELVLEIVNRFETNLLNTTAQGLDFIKATGSDHVTLHLDTFHMNIEEANPAAAIRLAGDKIGYFHIGESNRGYLGDGVIDFDRIFDALLDIGYDERHHLRILLERHGGRGPVAGLRDLARYLDRQHAAGQARQGVHRAEDGEAMRRRTTNARPSARTCGESGADVCVFRLAACAISCPSAMHWGNFRE